MSLRIDDAGVPTVIKHGAGATEAQRRRHEAEVLARLEGTATVRPRTVVDHGEDVELELEHVPARSLDACPPFGLDELAALGLGLARATDELHRRGVVHLAIEPSHVLVPDPASPVLCGLADAALAPPGETLDPSADDRALRRLLEQEVARSVAASLIDPADPRARQFEHIVSPARQPPPSTPAALTAALEAFTSSASPAAGEVQPSPTLRGIRRRIPWLGIAGALMALAVLGAAWLTRDDGDPGSAAPSTAATPTDGSAGPGTTPTSGHRDDRHRPGDHDRDERRSDPPEHDGAGHQPAHPTGVVSPPRPGPRIGRRRRRRVPGELRGRNGTHRGGRAGVRDRRGRRPPRGG